MSILPLYGKCAPIKKSKHPGAVNKTLADYGMTASERQIVEKIAEGLSDKEKSPKNCS
jgi:hypothetical protein